MHLQYLHGIGAAQNAHIIAVGDDNPIAGHDITEVSYLVDSVGVELGEVFIGGREVNRVNAAV